ncbi:MAG: glutamate synthase subunit beta [Acidobacteriota bacterium]
MGKPTGFIDFPREPIASRAPLDRVHDWAEFHAEVPEATLQRQGARCMDCGTPFCHTGTIIAGMASGCPLGNLIPDWNDLVFRGLWKEAAVSLCQTNNFPEFTGRVCPAPCEGSCTLGLNDDAVAIKSIESAIADRAFDEGWITAEAPVTRTGKRVAIVGSGPAGLACAAQLNKAGHTVTIFERADRIGGLLMYGIPGMKLDKRLVDRRVRLMADAGVRFVTGVEVGRDVPSQRLIEDYDAAVLCCGAALARDLPVEARGLSGIHLAMEFLHASTKSLLDSAHGDGLFISARAKHVVVIGGGDTGTDCVGTALRHHATSVVQFEILPRPPVTRAPGNPWPQWPRTYTMDYGQEEAAALYGADPRRYAVQTTRFMGDVEGRVCEVHTINVEWTPDASGRVHPVGIQGSERVFPADLVLLALGFLGPDKKGPLTDLSVAIDQRGNVVTDADKMTSVPGIFAAGDMSRGQSLVVWAIHEGRRAAQGVDRYLMYGESYLP